ncbi:MAG: 50S ribosomal protein L18 [Flavobacteriales bacterium]|nr:50S ribosomal protein L18 [Flavobacteriales bacterium]MBU28150.1 50S ribosomal protein L18 [Flavobacteriales bacterium]|tara:strand:+ start:238 stop:594 length:357 start_codon:yes stop_codon:yes gene_type:complete
MIDSKKVKRQKIRYKIRKRISGSQDIPRLAVFRSNKEIYAQLIDDSQSATLASASSRDKSICDQKSTKVEKAKMVGKLIAERAKESGVKNVVFDRGGFLYHGRIKALAESAREAGLKF